MWLPRFTLCAPVRRCLQGGFFVRKLLLLMACIGSGSPVFAADILVVGTTFARIYEQNDQGEFSGFGVAVIRAMAEQSGDRVTFQMLPWPRAQLMVERNEAQILVGPYKNAEREAKFAFAGRAFYRDDMVYYKRRNAEVQWDGTYPSLKALKIGTISGWAYGSQFESHRNTLQMDTAVSLSSGLDMLLADRFDLLASNVRNTEAISKDRGLVNTVVALAPPIGKEYGYMAFCKSAACDSVRLRYDEIHGRLIARGELVKLARKYAVSLP